MGTRTNHFSTKLFSEATWPDFEALFGKHRGVRGGCWCTWHLCTSTQFIRMSKDQRREFQHDLVQQGLGSGLLVYDGSTPVAWCQFGPAGRFPGYDRMRAYKQLELAPELRPDWRISCLFVDKHRRKEGLSQLALKFALQHIGSQGGGVVEAFPLDVPGITRPQYTGSQKMYLEEGFETVARLGKSTLLMRKIA